MSLLELKNAAVSFDTGSGRTLRACSDINLTIDKGEIVTVVGESGCGKSTMGKLCLGVQRPTEGQVLLKGRDLWARSFRWDRELRHSVQVIHQDSYASLNPVRTIHQILSAPLLYHRLAANRKEAAERVMQLLMSVGLTPPDYFAGKYPFQLSGGQRQRVSIVRAGLFNPSLIIADEPVSGVDSSLRLAILDLMKDMNATSSIAFFYITHDLATARYFGRGGKLIVMYLGSMVEQGEISSVMDNPRHPYLQALLAAIPVPDPRRNVSGRLIPLKSNDLPDPSRVPAGCPFSPRCPCSDDLCISRKPSLLRSSHGPDHLVACHHENDTVPLWKRP